MKKNRISIFGIIMFICLLSTGLFFVDGNRSRLAYADEVNSCGIAISQSLLTQIEGAYSDYSYKHTSDMGANYSLRDDYVIYTKNQNPENLCWAFASSEALSTTIMMATGEYIDFSEAWVTLAFDYNYDEIKTSYVGNDTFLSDGSSRPADYTVGTGGWFFMFDKIVKDYGVVLEQDFDFENLMIVSQENKNEYYNYYSQYANKELTENVKTVRYGTYDTASRTYKTTPEIRNSIKHHIKNYGGLYVGIDMSDREEAVYNSRTYYYKPMATKSGYGHAVTIIGWDDTFTSNDGKTGAWIALNQWGNHVDKDSVFYLMYEDTDIHSYFLGYVYDDTQQDDTYIDIDFTGEQLSSRSTSYGYYSTDKKGIYYYYFYAPSYGDTKQRNIFYSTSINLNYNYDISSETSIKRIKIYRGTADVTKSFNVKWDPTEKTIQISGSSVDIGGYKIVTEYKKNGEDTTQKHINAFYVCDGIELSHVFYNFSSDDGNAVKNNGRYQLYNNYTDTDTNVVVGSSTDTGHFIFRLYYATYNTVNESQTTYGSRIAYRSDLSTAGYCFGVQIDYDLNSTNNYTITLKNTNNKTRVITVTILKVGTNANMVNVIYNTNGGINNAQNQKRVVTSTSIYANIYAPTREGYNFAGWYYDSDFTSQVSKQSGQNIWLVANNKVNIITNPTVSSDFKSTFNSDYGYCASVFLYAKWEAVEYNLTIHYNATGVADDVSTIIYGDTIEEPEAPIWPGHYLLGWYSDVLFVNEWDFYSDVVYGDTDLYAKWEARNVRIYYVYENSTQTSGTIGYNSYLTKPADRNRTGYYDVWYTSSDYDTEFDFASTRVVEDTHIYVKSLLKPITNVELTTSTNSTETYTKFTLTLDYEHDLKGSLTVSVEWYRNDTLIETTSTLTYDEKVRTAGNYSYYAVLTITDSGNSANETSNSIGVTVAQKPIGIDNVTYNSRGNFTWTDSNPDGASYKVSIMRSVTGATYETLKTYPSQASTEIDIWSDLNEYGYYYVTVVKVFDGEEIGEVSSSAVSIVQLTYNVVFTDLTGYESKLYDAYDSITRPTSPSKTNYNFEGWYIDSNFTTTRTFPFGITTNTTIYAKWSYGTTTVLIENGSISSTYSNGNTSSLSVSASHSSGATNFTYEWYKIGSNSDTKVGSNLRTLTLGNVADSGNYYCIVTISDSNGIKSTARSNNMNVSIRRAETTISTENIGSYTYTGKLQKINSGAYVERTDEVVAVEYYFDSSRRTPAEFTDVPSSGYFMVYVYAPETDNYASATVMARVLIEKLQVQLSANSFQIIKYTGHAIIPEFTSNIDASQVKTSVEIINVGKYKDITLYVDETGNYKETSVTLSVLVEPANITVKAKNITSLWLTDIKNLEYEIIDSNGFDTSDLNIQLHCDVDPYKFGEYAITITSSNPNFIVTQIEGVYSVIVYPHIIAAIVILMIILFILIEQFKLTYIYEFESNGGSLVRPVDSKRFKKSQLPVPTKNGYKFLGWYLDKEFKKPIKRLRKGKVTTLYAKWEQIEDVKVSTVDEKILDILKHYTIDQAGDETDERIKLSDEELTNVMHMVKNSLHLEEDDENLTEQTHELTKEEIMQQFIDKINTEAVDGNISKEDIISIISEINQQ